MEIEKKNSVRKIAQSSNMNAKYKLTNQKLHKLDICAIAIYSASLEIYQFPNRIWTLIFTLQDLNLHWAIWSTIQSRHLTNYN